MDQRQVLTPRMIQGMEILQLPVMALEERIEQELVTNPVLEERDQPSEPDSQDLASTASDAPEPDGDRELVVHDSPTGDEFARLERLADYLDNEEFGTNQPARARLNGAVEDRDARLEALSNTASRSASLTDALLIQWSLLEVSPEIRKAGELILRWIDPDGYLRTPLAEIRQSVPEPPAMADLEAAWSIIRRELEPPGIGAKDLSDCLLLQLDALEEEGTPGHDFELERRLLRDHQRDLELNRYPQISRKLGRPIEEIQAAVARLARLHPHPGRLLGANEAHPIVPDAIVEPDPQTGDYVIRMRRDPGESLYISGTWRRYLRDRKGDKATRDFLASNLRNARWLLDALQQRRHTIQRVIRVVVDEQREFLEKGPDFLKPLPMTQVADQLGVHVATVSRAVSEKWIQTPRGIFPLRRFFTGGTTTASGEDVSWDAVREKLKAIIASEDKSNPLGDEQIVKKLAEDGITLARRTVAKYRDLLGIPTARQRRKYEPRARAG
jgi:RNA polymerase sigma-54 factor